jgi:hypothetical protein
LYPGQAEHLTDSYLPMLFKLCGVSEENARYFPIFHCMGGMGPCNGGTFKLPATNQQGVPKDIRDVATFINKARFSEMNAQLKKINVLPVCYESCRSSLEIFVKCEKLKNMAIDTEFKACDGLPKIANGEPCNGIPGDISAVGKTSFEASPTTTKVSPSPTGASKEKPAENSASSVSVGYLAIVVILAMMI